MGSQVDRHLQQLTMKFISAYAMCVLGGNDSPTVADIKKVVSAAGAEVSDEDNKKVEDFVEEMAGQNFYELVANGLEKVKMCAGRGGGSAAPAAASAPPQPHPQQRRRRAHLRMTVAEEAPCSTRTTRFSTFPQARYNVRAN